MPLDIITYNKLQKAIKDGNNLAGWTEESEQLNGKITEVDTRLTSELAQIATYLTSFPKVTPEVDDTARINRAIDSVFSKGGGKVLLGEDTYTISSNLNLKSNVSLVGSDKFKTIIKATANDSGIVANDLSNVTIENLTLDANYFKSGISVEAISSDVKNIDVNHVIVKNTGKIADSTTWYYNIKVKRWGIYSVTDVRLTNLYCEHATGDGTGFGDNILVESFGSDGSGKLTNVLIENCILKKAGRQNISLSGDHTVSKPTNVIINNIICEDSTMGGIDFEETDKVTISNIHFVNSGKYTAFYNGAHFAERFPNTIMRSAISLHGDNNAVVTNCIFTNCHYGLGGYGNGLMVSNSKFFDSKISNGDLSGAGKWRINNCEINGSGVIDYLVNTHLGRVIFNGCTFKGKTTSGHMVKLTVESSSETYYRESGFQSCDFTGVTDRSMSAFYISYGTYTFDNCIFNDFNIVFNCYQSSGRARIFINGGNIRKTNKIVEGGYVAIDKLVMKNVVAEKIKQIAKFSLRQYHVSIEGCEFYLEINTEDTTTHLGVDIPVNAGVQNFRFKDNYMVNEGTATDVIGVRSTVRSQEVATDMINISDNEFKNVATAITIPLYSGSTKAISSIVKNNQSIGVTALIGDKAGTNTTSSIIKDNLENGTIVA